MPASPPSASSPTSPHSPGASSDRTEQEKQTAAEAAVELVESGMKVGLGTGSTVEVFLPLLALRALDVVCVATSPATETAAKKLGLNVSPFDLDRLDVAIDGADQVAPDHWLVKGGGGAHTREKVVAAAAERFVVIVSSNKLVDRVSAPIPLEVMAFGAEATLRALPGARVRAATPPTPDGGIIADWYGEFDDPAALAAKLDSVPGVVGHGLFAPALVHHVIVGHPEGAEHLPATSS